MPKVISWKEKTAWDKEVWEDSDKLSLLTLGIVSKSTLYYRSMCAKVGLDNSVHRDTQVNSDKIKCSCASTVGI